MKNLTKNSNDFSIKDIFLDEQAFVIRKVVQESIEKTKNLKEERIKVKSSSKTSVKLKDVISN